jgi:hypothetical protein
MLTRPSPAAAAAVFCAAHPLCCCCCCRGAVCRAFRLFLSSKYGRSSWLRCTPRWGGAGLTPQEMFHRSLVTFAAPPGSSSSTCMASWPGGGSTGSPLQISSSSSSSSASVQVAAQAVAGNGLPAVAVDTEQPQQQQQPARVVPLPQQSPGYPSSTCAGENQSWTGSMYSTVSAAHAGPAAAAAAAGAAATGAWARQTAPGHTWQHPWLPAAQAVYCPLGRPAPTSLLHMPPLDWAALLQALPPAYASLPMLHQPCLMGAGGHSSMWPAPVLSAPPAAAGATAQGQVGRGAAVVDWGAVLPGPSPFPGVEQLLQHHCQQVGEVAAGAWAATPA